MRLLGPNAISLRSLALLLDAARLKKVGALRNSYWSPLRSTLYEDMKPVLTPDIVVAGADIIGLTLALELQHRGASVAVLDTAAAARRCFHGRSRNAGRRRPAQSCRSFSELSLFSISLYDRFLDRLSGALRPSRPVPDNLDHPVSGRRSDPPTRRKVDRSRASLQPPHSRPSRSRIPLIEHSGPARDITSTRVGILSSVHSTARLRAKSPHPRIRRLVPAVARPSPHAKVRCCVCGPRRPEAARGSPQLLHLRRPPHATARRPARRSSEPPKRTPASTLTSRKQISTTPSRAAVLLPALGSTRPPLRRSRPGQASVPQQLDGLPLIGRLPVSSQSVDCRRTLSATAFCWRPATAVALADLSRASPPLVDLLPFDPARLA